MTPPPLSTSPSIPNQKRKWKFLFSDQILTTPPPFFRNIKKIFCIGASIRIAQESQCLPYAQFLDALASLVLMIVTDSLTGTQTDWKLTFLYHFSCHHWDWDTSQSLKIESHSKLIVTMNGMSLKRKCHSKWNITPNGMSLKKNITQNRMSHKMDYHSKWNVTQTRISLNMECHSKWIPLKM